MEDNSTLDRIHNLRTAYAYATIQLHDERLLPEKLVQAQMWGLKTEKFVSVVERTRTAEQYFQPKPPLFSSLDTGYRVNSSRRSVPGCIETPPGAPGGFSRGRGEHMQQQQQTPTGSSSLNEIDEKEKSLEGDKEEDVKVLEEEEKGEEEEEEEEGISWTGAARGASTSVDDCSSNSSWTDHIHNAPALQSEPSTKVLHPPFQQCHLPEHPHPYSSSGSVGFRRRIISESGTQWLIPYASNRSEMQSLYTADICTSRTKTPTESVKLNRMHPTAAENASGITAQKKQFPLAVHPSIGQSPTMTVPSPQGLSLTSPWPANSRPSTAGMARNLRLSSSGGIPSCKEGRSLISDLLRRSNTVNRSDVESISDEPSSLLKNRSILRSNSANRMKNHSFARRVSNPGHSVDNSSNLSYQSRFALYGSASAMDIGLDKRRSINGEAPGMLSKCSDGSNGRTLTSSCFYESKGGTVKVHQKTVWRSKEGTFHLQ